MAEGGGGGAQSPGGPLAPAVLPAPRPPVLLALPPVGFLPLGVPGGLGATLQQFAWPVALHSFRLALTSVDNSDNV